TQIKATHQSSIAAPRVETRRTHRDRSPSIPHLLWPNDPLTSRLTREGPLKHEEPPVAWPVGCSGGFASVQVHTSPTHTGAHQHLIEQSVFGGSPWGGWSCCSDPSRRPCPRRLLTAPPAPRPRRGTRESRRSCFDRGRRPGRAGGQPSRSPARRQRLPSPG